jgi:hypothetical protein
MNRRVLLGIGVLPLAVLVAGISLARGANVVHGVDRVNTVSGTIPAGSAMNFFYRPSEQPAVVWGNGGGDIDLYAYADTRMRQRVAADTNPDNVPVVDWVRGNGVNEYYLQLKNAGPQAVRFILKANGQIGEIQF